MIKFTCIPRVLRTAIVAISLFAAGCGSNSPAPQAAVAGVVTIDPKVLVTGVSPPASCSQLHGLWAAGSGVVFSTASVPC